MKNRRNRGKVSPFVRNKDRRKDAITLLKRADRKIKDMGDLIDLPMDVFTKYVEVHYNVGECKMLKDQFRLVYDNLVARKDTLLSKYKDSSDAVERAKIEDAVKRLYIVLQRLEGRIVYLEGREKSLLKKGE